MVHCTNPNIHPCILPVTIAVVIINDHFNLKNGHPQEVSNCDPPPILFYKLKCWKCWSLNLVQLFATPWAVTYQAPPSMGFSRQEYWSGVPFPSPGNHPNPRIKPRSPAWQADSLTSEPPGKPSKAETMTNTHTQTLRHSHIPKPTDLRIQSIPVSWGLPHCSLLLLLGMSCINTARVRGLEGKGGVG